MFDASTIVMHMILQSSKPRILLLPDVRGWAFDTIAHGMKQYLSDIFYIDIAYSREDPHIDEHAYDIIHVMWGKEDLYRKHLTGATPLIKSVYSHAWEEEGISLEAYCASHLYDADAITVPSNILQNEVQKHVPRTHLVPGATDTKHFRILEERSGPLIAGWAGNAARPIKQFSYVEYACADIVPLVTANKTLPYSDMPRFYNEIDIILCSSQYEGTPQTIMEAMACGAFPVCFPVGIAPEVIDHQVNGYLVEEMTADALRNAMLWCANHLEHIRSMRRKNSALMQKTRDFSVATHALAALYSSTVCLRT